MNNKLLIKVQYILIIICLLIIISISIIVNKDTNHNLSFTQEATPIRVKDKIVGMKYDININKHKEKYTIDTKVVDSIYHYTDTSRLNDFFIKFNLVNNTNKKCYLKKIIIYDRKKIVKTYNYKKLLRKNEININISNDIISKIFNSNKVLGKIKIVIEK